MPHKKGKRLQIRIAEDVELVLTPKRASQSWWIGKSREELGPAAVKEIPRMRESKFAGMQRMNTD